MAGSCCTSAINASADRPSTVFTGSGSGGGDSTTSPSLDQMATDNSCSPVEPKGVREGSGTGRMKALDDDAPSTT